MQQEFKNIADSNEEMLTYFNRLYSEHESNLQDYKARLFEINIKLDELNRTKTVYSQSSDFRKNVFSPINLEHSENDKERKLKDEISSLTRSQQDYEDKIDDETIILKSIDKKVKKLELARDSIILLSSKDEKNSEEIQRGQDRQRELEKQIEEERTNAYKAAEETRNYREKEIRKEVDKHLNNILTIITYDRTYYSTVLDKKIKNELSRNEKILEQTRNYIAPNPGKAKQDLDQVIDNMKYTLHIIDDQLRKMYYYLDEKTPIRSMLNDYVAQESKKHKDILIEYSFGAFTNKLDYIRYIVLKNLLDIFFDNIYKHSKADYVTFVVKEVDNNIEVVIADNGHGIGENYLATKECYSGINRAQELIYMLRGNLEITEDKGTKVKFTFSFE